ncbi:hypothetical protein [Leuconostoc citreum]|uniref:hypothetical protein n=1 Tax=Leuconostoc citreum TaxID=33964 RepID=UPI0012BA3ADA|nr:hypothetical protein [Leuconostoc citreum]QGN59905.1 hypothetical protein GJ636_00125 [Leuconostoc citreum]QGN59947.1 hypothetical protein GJ636_00355 [Leuconostoc citreum]
MSYTVLDENLQVKGRLSLNNGQGNTTFFSDTITTQMATDNANDPAGLTTVDYTNQDKQGNAKQWSHTLTISVEATNLGTSINTTDYLMYFDSVADHYYLMKVINTSTDRNSGFITVSAINAAIFELGKQLIQAEQTLAQVDLKTFVSKMYKNAPFSLRVADDNLTVIDYVVSANTSLQALLQDLQTKYDVDVDSWVELDETGRIADRVLYFGHLGSDNGELIRYGGAKGFENMTATEVSDIIYTKLYVTGKTDDKDTTKGHIGTVNNGLEYITDDDANQLMYAIGASQQQPVYLEGTITNSLLSEPKALLEWAKQQIGIFNHPRFNYTVSPLHDQIVALGDTVTVQDFHIKPEILVTSKVIQKTVSFASPETNTFVLGEFSSIFTDNMNKSANVINLIKKDVTVVQEAADIAKAQADAAYQQAVLAQEKAIHAQTSADGKTTSYTVDSVQDLPQSANEGDIGWVKLSDGAHMYSYTDGKWVEKINPSMGSDIDKKVSDAVTQSKDYSDKAIADNQVKLDASIKSVDDKANQLKQDQSALDTKAQGYANQAKADAIANTAEIEQQLRQSIADGNSGLQTQITSNKDAIALTATKTELNDAKTDYNAQISSLNVKADGITQTVTQVSDKVDNLQVGGRNYVLNSSGVNSSGINRPNVNGVNNTEVYNNQGNLYTPDGLFMEIKNVHSEMFYSLINAWTNLSDIPQLKAGNTYTISCVVVGSFDYVAFRISDIWYNPIPLNHTTLTKVSQTFTIPEDATQIYIRLNVSNGKSGDQNFFEGQAIIAKNFKLEDGNIATAWTPAPEDTDSKFSQQQQTIDSINSTVQQQGTNISNVSTRVQTAEGNISTVQNNINGIESSQRQTADGLSQEVRDRQSGDSTVLQQGKDFTTSQVSNSESNMRSLISQKADSATIGVIQNDVATLKSNTQWQRIERFDDMNYMMTTGRFFVGASAGTNSAVSASFYIVVDAPQADRITQTQWKDLDGSLMYRRTYNGSSWTPWTQMVMSSTLLNIFHDSWSLGTTTNDGITKQMVTGIMGQPDGTLILKGNSLILDGNTTVTGDFYAKGGNFQNLNASNIKVGTLDGYQVNIANVNVNNLVGDTITGFNINANRQINIAPGGELKSSVVNMGANSFDVVAQNINSSRISSEGFKVSEVNGTFNISSSSGHVSSSGTISVNSPGQSSSYKTGNFSSEYNGNNILIYTTDYNNGDPDEFLNISSAQFDISHTKTGLLSDATDYTKIRANLIETTGTLNAFSGAQIPSIYSYPNLTLESKNQSVLLKAGGNVILQVRENGYMYMLTRHAGSGGRSLQIDDDGGIFFSSSSSKYKTDIQYDGSTSVGDKFLTLDPVTWQDKGDYEQRKLYRENGTEPDHQIYMDDKRYYGLIAEDLVKAGLEEFVVRDSRTGEVEGLEYDKVAISLIPVVREQRTAINELKVEIERLKDKVK